MADEIDSNGESSTQTLESPEQQSPENMVTPEIEQKFEQVFGTSRSKASKTSDEGKKPSTSKRLQRQQEEAESLSSLEDSNEDDLEEGDFSKDESDEDEEELDDDEDDDAGKVSGKKAGSDKKAGKDGSDATPTLDPTLRHAARRGGFTNEEIDELVRENPQLAEKTFTKLYEGYSGLSAKYSQIAMAAQAQEQNSQQQRQTRVNRPATSAREESDVLGAIYGDDLEKFTEKYGDDFFGEVLQPLVDRLQRPIAEMYEHFQEGKKQQIASEASQFFKNIDPGMAELYGNGKTPTPEQVNARQELAVLADRIRIGARAQGEDLSVTEALELACMSHAREHLGKIERKKLVEQVRNRSKSMVTRPSQRKQGAAPKGKGGASIQAAMEAYASKAADLGIDL